jgi:uncharacterized protein YbaR (Trm112 family)
MGASPISLPSQQIRRLERLHLDPALFSKEVITGVLLNRARKVFYPIHHGVPRMLTFPTGVTRYFARSHAARINSELAEFTLPHEEPMTGEETVLRTFSSEWVNEVTSIMDSERHCTQPAIALPPGMYIAIPNKKCARGSLRLGIETYSASATVGRELSCQSRFSSLRLLKKQERPDPRTLSELANVYQHLIMA